MNPSRPRTSTVHLPGAGSTSVHTTICGVSITLDSARSLSVASTPAGFLKLSEPVGPSLKNTSDAAVVLGAMFSDAVKTSPDASSSFPISNSVPLASWLRMLSAITFRSFGEPSG